MGKCENGSMLKCNAERASSFQLAVAANSFADMRLPEKERTAIN